MESIEQTSAQDQGDSIRACLSITPGLYSSGRGCSRGVWMKSSVFALILLVPLSVLVAPAFGQTTQPQSAPPRLLGPEFRSAAHGVALCPPVHCEKTPVPPSGAIAEFD